ncbi:MAG: helix-turn-helix domain-containing protein [Coriobacteriia bacterium]|nr:helix-turn-helix domain-containing protein [Coriobacteriia bacterium]
MQIIDTNDFGHAVRQARKARGLSQQQLADLSGVGITFVSNLERGKTTSELEKAIQVALTAGLDIDMHDRMSR